jgi:ribosomal protein L37AE/L43A
MSSNWFFDKKTAGWLSLECPTCSNNKIFKGTAYQDQLIWHCHQCGNNLLLNLKPINKTALN